MRRTPWDVLRAVLRRAVPPGGADPPPDAELLDRFVRSRDEAAFELLLWRHAGLVLGVCRRIVRDDHLAEDAFQATFLVLARKAGSVRRTASLAGWLHRVARRVAGRAAKKKRTAETPLAVDPIAPAIPVHDDGLRRVIDQEIDRLPDRYRLPVVLCYVQEHTTEEAARLLGVPRGTILSRLATAREKLARRLSRRGVTAPAAGLAVLGGSSATATDDLIQTTFRAAAAFAAGTRPATVSALLATEVLRMTAWKTTAGVVVGLLLAAGAGTGLGVVASERTKEADSTAEQARPELPQKPRTEPGIPAEPEKDREARRDRQLKVLDQQYEAINAQIAALMREKQQHTQADDVDVGVLRAQLLRLDERILQAEESVPVAESNLRRANAAWDQAGAIRADPGMFANMVGNDGGVRAAIMHMNQLQATANDIEKSLAEPDKSIQLKKLREEIAKAEHNLKKIQQEVLDAAKADWVDNARRQVRARLDSAKESYVEAVANFESLRKKRVELVKRIAEARISEVAILHAEDELRVYRELKQQLLRKRLVLQLEKEGIFLPEAGREALAENRVEQLLREIEELKVEVRQLGQQKHK